uniref:Uncharacterized protein n=1 Tax=Talaromyces marneffei PM1 TaxID=1077442 RepID=A0A093X8B8_TALMA
MDSFHEKTTAEEVYSIHT